MASIFGNKAPKQPEFKQALLDSEASVLKRLTIFMEETSTKFKGLNDWVKKTGDQVNELLKRTFDLQRKVEGQLIDVENAQKREVNKLGDKLTVFEKKMSGKYLTRTESTELTADIAGTIKKLRGELDVVGKEVKKVERKIPANTITKDAVSDIVSDLTKTIEKIANAIPTNVAKNSTVADIRKELIDMMQVYATIEAVKAVGVDADKKIAKTNKAVGTVAGSNKKVTTDFNKVASKVNEIEQDYIPSKFIPELRKEIKASATNLTKQIGSVENKIPTDVVKTNDVEVVREFQKQLKRDLEDKSLEISKHLNTTEGQLNKNMVSLQDELTLKMEDIRQSVLETAIGEDKTFLENIVRQLVTDEVQAVRNASMLFQENTKQSVIEIKNQNRAMASKMNELQGAFNKLIALQSRK